MAIGEVLPEREALETSHQLIVGGELAEVIERTAEKYGVPTDDALLAIINVGRMTLLQVEKGNQILFAPVANGGPCGYMNFKHVAADDPAFRIFALAEAGIIANKKVEIS